MASKRREAEALRRICDLGSSGRQHSLLVGEMYMAAMRGLGYELGRLNDDNPCVWLDADGRPAPVRMTTTTTSPSIARRPPTRKSGGISPAGPAPQQIPPPPPAPSDAATSATPRQIPRD